MEVNDSGSGGEKSYAVFLILFSRFALSANRPGGAEKKFLIIPDGEMNNVRDEPVVQLRACGNETPPQAQRRRARFSKSGRISVNISVPSKTVDLSGL